MIVLRKRTPENDEEVKYEWDDDPYSHQIEAFVADVEGEKKGRVLSTFEDAVQTYEFTWGIRQASERRGIRHLLVVLFLSLMGISFI
jgi:hypothetical protein